MRKLMLVVCFGFAVGCAGASALPQVKLAGPVPCAMQYPPEFPDDGEEPWSSEEHSDGDFAPASQPSAGPAVASRR